MNENMDDRAVIEMILLQEAKELAQQTDDPDFSPWGGKFSKPQSFAAGKTGNC